MIIGVTAAFVGIAKVVHEAPAFTRSMLSAMRRVIRFNDALPAMESLPQTLEKYEKRFDQGDKRFDAQDAMMRQMLEELKTAKAIREQILDELRSGRESKTGSK